jgi:hypothetical protein
MEKIVGKMSFLPGSSFVEKSILQKLFRALGEPPIRFAVNDRAEISPTGVPPVGTVRIRDLRTLLAIALDPATTELTGPTITDPTNPDLDYSYCDSDRRHVVNASVVAAARQHDTCTITLSIPSSAKEREHIS